VLTHLQRDIRYWAIRYHVDFNADYCRQDFMKVALIFKKVRTALVSSCLPLTLL
jgi:hypothetical protein